MKTSEQIKTLNVMINATEAWESNSGIKNRVLPKMKEKRLILMNRLKGEILLDERNNQLSVAGG